MTKKFITTFFIVLAFTVIFSIGNSINQSHSSLSTEITSSPSANNNKAIDPFDGLHFVCFGGIPEVHILKIIPKDSYASRFSYSIDNYSTAIHEGETVTVKCYVGKTTKLTDEYKIDDYGYVYKDYPVTSDNFPTLLNYDTVSKEKLSFIDDVSDLSISNFIDLYTGCSKIGTTELGYSIKSIESFDYLNSSFYYTDTYAKNAYVKMYKATVLDENDNKHNLYVSSKVNNVVDYNGKTGVINNNIKMLYTITETTFSYDVGRSKEELQYKMANRFGSYKRIDFCYIG